MTDIKKLEDKYEEFKKERNWEKFHQPKNIAMSITIESSELMELFQWKDNVDIEKIRNDEDLMSEIREELADIILYSLSMTQRLDIDIEDAVEEKLYENKERFDEETAAEMSKELQKWRKD
jgi:NTP pyrophosphatase (non-canonical NTP hydrolase)